MLQETLGFQPPPGKTEPFAEGIIRVRRLPEDLWTPEQYASWWLPEKDDAGRIVRLPRMSEREKDRYTEAVFKNQIMTAARTLVLSFIGSSSGNTTGLAKYLAIGTGAIQATAPTDTSLATETFRKAQASNTVAGTQVDINFQLLAGDANSTFTNCGVFGNTATATLGSGTLYTHALFAYTKGAYSISIDYLIILV